MGDDSGSRREFHRIECNIKLRFRSVEELREEYSRNISRNGIFVKTDQPLDIMDYVTVTLELPPPQPAISLTAYVVHIITKEEAVARKTEPGVGLHFVDLTDEHKYLLESYICEEMERVHEKKSENKRKHVRKNIRLVVKFTTDGALKKKYTRDISRGGIFIETKNPLPVGQVAKVSLVHPLTDQEMEFESKVIRHMKNENGEVTGMALSFIDFHKRKTELKRFVNSVMVLEPDS